MTKFEPEFLLVQVGCGRSVATPGVPTALPFFAHNTFPAEHREGLGGGDAEIQSHGKLLYEFHQSPPIRFLHMLLSALQQKVHTVLLHRATCTTM